MLQWSRSRSRTVVAAALLALSTSVPAVELDLPKGHYLSFARERNLATEMLEPLNATGKVSDYQLRTARDLEDALRTPGVKGLYMHFDWRTLEVADGVYDFSLIDTNIAVARRYGLEFIVQISDRSFDGKNILPTYFPSQYVLWSTGNGNAGVVAKRWDPYVYNRLIRLYRAIAARYADEPAFGGLSTSETATGDFSGGDYSIEKYRHALTRIVTETQAAMSRGALFFYLNFLKGGVNVDMNKDVRVQLLADVPHDRLIVGAPDITPDVPGMPGSVNSYRIRVRKTMPSVRQFCHVQHVDLGLGGINIKSNKHRQEYYQQVASIRERESQSWFKGPPAAFEFDELRVHAANRVDLHPASVLGDPWTPAELLDYGVRNFGCDYVLWHYREWSIPGGFDWPHVQDVIRNNQCFYMKDGCDQLSLRPLPRPPRLR